MSQFGQVPTCFEKKLKTPNTNTDFLPKVPFISEKFN